jgi:hypothetical protein
MSSCLRTPLQLSPISRPEQLDARNIRVIDCRVAGLEITDDQLVGFACLVMRRPASCSDAGDMQHLPQIVDLRV